jgi:hypothetical protein
MTGCRFQAVSGDPVPTKPVTPRDRRRAPRTFSLEVIAGPQTGRRFADLPARCSIGSHPSNAVVIDDPTVSRFHCDLIADGDVLRVVDRTSLNGTRVDHVEVEHAIVRGDARLALGDTVIRVAFQFARQAEPATRSASFGSLVGESDAMAALFNTLARAASSDATVLLEGETGTGKEGAAEGIHLASSRAEQPFVAVDCSAIRAR